MSMEIRGIGPYFDIPGGPIPGTLPQQAPEQADTNQKTLQYPRQDMKKVLTDLQQISQVFDRRLQFSMDRSIGRIVVKVIDIKTDKVIRELPPKEIQELYRRIREAIGLLFDHKV